MSIRFHATPLAAKGAGDLRRTAEAQAARRRNGSLEPALLATGAARANLDALLSGKALAVTSGQQAGLFTGPLYTILKALSAAAMARAMAAAGMGTVVPVMWVAGDDHDFAEINHCVVLGQDGKPVRITLRERPAEAPMLPAYREPTLPDARAALAQLEAALPPGTARDETLAWLTQAYASGDPARDNLAEAHAVALAELLGPFGVVVARGWSGALKQAARDVVLAAAEQAADLDLRLAREAEALRAAGAAVTVDVGDGVSLLMYEGAQGRDRLRITGPGQFATRRGNQPVTLEDLKDVLAREPERISGNVLLRPAIEAAVFPSVAYFGGPGELAYLAQTGPVFELLGVPRPARLPRLSGMLIDAKADKVLERYLLSPGDFAQPEGALSSRIARESLPESAAAALLELREAITSIYARVQAEAAAIDKTLERTAENARNQALMGTQELEKKLVAALKRTHETAIGQVSRVRDQLFPSGEPQERVLSVVSFLGRYGRDVMGLLDDAAMVHARALLEAPPGRA